MAERRFRMPRNSTGLLPELPWQRKSVNCSACDLEIGLEDATPVTFDPPVEGKPDHGYWCSTCVGLYF